MRRCNLKLLIILPVIFVLLILIVVIESARECALLKTTTYNIYTKGIFSKERPVKIALLSDLHNCFSNKGKKIIDIVKREKPDLIILAGDMLLSHSDQLENNKKTAGLINNLCELAPVYFGMGNHETAVSEESRFKHLWSRFSEELSDKVVLLRNSSADINIDEKKINIYGLELQKKYYKRFSNLKPTKEEIDKLIAKNDSGDYNILIAHNPDFFETYADWGADLILSGHNHGGMVRIPGLGGIISPKPVIFPKYDYGLYRRNDTIMIVSGGMGSHSVKIRINNKPELVILKLM